MAEVTLKVNGEDRRVSVGDEETLLDVLRDKLNLTGTKKGCELGVCGACTVLIDGETVNSCIFLAKQAVGKDVMTIEGLAKDGELHPLQKSFVANGAIQCGYCTPGMVLSAYALITRNPDPTEEEIKDAMGGNICRCTGYTRILKAIKGWRVTRGLHWRRHRWCRRSRQGLWCLAQQAGVLCLLLGGVFYSMP